MMMDGEYGGFYFSDSGLDSFMEWSGVGLNWTGLDDGKVTHWEMHSLSLHDF